MKHVENKFKVGDRVRHLIKKEVFDKNDKSKFSKETHHILRISGNKIYLEGIVKFFKPYELMRVKRSENKPENEPENLEEKIDKHNIDELKIERLNKKSKQIVKRELGNVTNVLPSSEKRVRNLPARYRF